MNKMELSLLLRMGRVLLSLTGTVFVRAPVDVCVGLWSLVETGGFPPGAPVSPLNDTSQMPPIC